MKLDPTWVWIFALFLLFLGGVLYRLHRAMRRALRRGRPGTPCPTHHPVLLVHGLLGHGPIHLGPVSMSYFRGVTEHLESLGVRVHEPHLPPAGSIERRSQKLAAHVRRLGVAKVNILAHSLGGLDARLLVHHPEVGDRIASVVTIGTPHRGTPLADEGRRWVGELGFVRAALRRLGLDIEAFWELTTERLRRFNRMVPNRRGVFYASVVATASREHVHPLLRPTHRFLTERAGPNDGLVPAASQRWGGVLRRIEADHWAEIGLSRSFDAPALYEDLVRELRGRGL